jgi:2-methylisocitrate lyase-like PEP mutase family enzyme
VSAAREAIGDADFFLVARTDARGVNAKYGLEVRKCMLRFSEHCGTGVEQESNSTET